MNNILYSITNKVIENYRLAKYKLRFDGEYINHFASLIFTGNDNIDIDKIKEIRKYIKTNTNKMSSFRGDILYMLSILISKENNYKEFSDKVIKINEKLEENDFKENDFLVLSSYTIAKHINIDEVYNIIKDMKIIYNSLKENYKGFTDEEDYLACALLAIKNNKDKGEAKNIHEYIESMFNHLSDLDYYSKNDLQGIASSIVLNDKASAPYEIKELINAFNENGMKIGDEVLPLIGIIEREENIKSYLDKINEVNQYLCDEDGEYAFYMDKTFRTLIAIVIVEVYELLKNSTKNEFLNELVCFSIYSFLVSKKQGIFEEVLA
ncbi:DUF4003 family protein [Clostridium sp. Ade.TY]|uniref:DUF4003 family protein n=1 Tax=Clostridium sp. Ade.TY TaxID=1391647 RepID=UPI000406DB55|nr:DUF4003 family protein [Clostridium sp. Ade.TY]